MPGLDCGSSGIVVIDCDCRASGDGETEFRALCSELGIDLVDVPHVTTPSGGRHFYFRQPTGQLIKNSAGALASDVDVRGDGGFVVAAGAHRLDGRGYTPAHPASLDDFIQTVARGELPDLPSALVNRIADSARAKPPALFDAAVTHGVKPRVINDALWAGIRPQWDIGQACARVITAPEGTRNDTLNREAFTAGLRVAAGDLDAEEALVALADAACVAGLSDDEIAKTITASLQRGNASAAPRANIPYGTGQWERTGAGNIKRSFKNAMLALHALGVEASRNTFSESSFCPTRLDLACFRPTTLDRSATTR